MPDINQTLLVIPEVRACLNKDKSSGKFRTRKVLQYCFLMFDNASPYSEHPNKQELAEEEALANKMTKSFDELSVVEKALVNRMQEICITPEMRLLKSAIGMCNKIAEYLESMDFGEKDERGRLIHDVSTRIKDIKSVKEASEALAETRAALSRKAGEAAQGRGGITLPFLDDIEVTEND